MPITINDPDPIINVTVVLPPPINISITQEETKVIQVQPATLQGQKGDTPDKSIYSKREITASEPTLAIDASLATTFIITLESDVALSISGWPPEGKTQRIALYLVQDTVGNRKVTAWPDNTKWSFGEIPLLSVTPGATDCVIIDSYDRGQTIFAGIVGLAYA